MMKTLKERTISGVKWQVANKLAQKVISVATFAVLARLLEPSVFGLFAMAFLLIDGLAMFQGMGLDAGLIQKRHYPEKAQHTAFFTLQLMGLTMFLICFAAAPAVGGFFKQPKVGEISRVLGFIFILSCFSRIPLALLVKEMKFKITALVEIIGTVANSVFAIAFVMIWPSVWSLVWAYVIKQSLMAVSTWYFSGYKLKWEFDVKIAMELFHFGKFLTGLAVIGYINSHLAVLVVGKVLGPVLLGYFTLAKNATSFINTHFTLLVSRVMFPAYSMIQKDPAALKRVYLKTIKFVSIFTVPFSMALIVLARELVLTLYGEKWLPVVPLIQILGLNQIIAPVIACSGSIFSGCGKPEYSWRLGSIQLALAAPLIVFLTLKFGVLGAVSTTLITHAVMIPIYLYHLKKLVDFRIKEFTAQLVPSFVCAAAMLAVITAAQLLVGPRVFSAKVSLENLAHLLIYGMIGFITYMAVFWFVDRSASREVKKMLFKWESV